METIIGLLFVLLPVIFKLIEKKLKESGKIQHAESLHEITDLFTEEDQEEQTVHTESVARIEEHKDVVDVRVPDSTKLTMIEGQRSLHKSSTPSKSSVKKTMGKRPPILQEEVKTKKKEKIDPKKLVIYSEIMKPKYQE